MRRPALVLLAGPRKRVFLDAQTALIKLDGRESDFVFGLGVEGKISETMSARVDFLTGGDVDADVVRAALNFKLGGY